MKFSNNAIPIGQNIGNICLGCSRICMVMTVGFNVGWSLIEKEVGKGVPEPGAGSEEKDEDQEQDE